MQGVGFRYFAERTARLEGLGGWVANRADGSVEILAEGELAALERFEAKVQAGPPGARVDRVTVDDDVPSGRVGEFRIRGDR